MKVPRSTPGNVYLYICILYNYMFFMVNVGKYIPYIECLRCRFDDFPPGPLEKLKPFKAKIKRVTSSNAA